MIDADKTGAVTIWNMSLRILSAHAFRVFRSAFRKKRILIITSSHLAEMRKEYRVTTTSSGWSCDFGSAR